MLPSDILERVHQFVPAAHRWVVGGVCRGWRDVARSALKASVESIVSHVGTDRYVRYPNVQAVFSDRVEFGKLYELACGSQYWISKWIIRVARSGYYEWAVSRFDQLSRTRHIDNVYEEVGFMMARDGLERGRELIWKMSRPLESYRQELDLALASDVPELPRWWGVIGADGVRLREEYRPKLIRRAIGNGHPEAAERLLGGEWNYKNQDLLAEVAKGFARQGKYERALGLGQIFGRGYEVCRLVVARHQVEVGDLMGAKRLLKVAYDPEARDFRCRYAKELVNAGKVAGGILFAHSLQCKQSRWLCYSQVARDLARRKEYRLAHVILEHLPGEGANWGYEEKWVYQECAECAAENGDLGAVKRFLSLMKAESVNDGVYAGLAMNSAKKGNEQASKIWTDRIQGVERKKGCQIERALELAKLGRFGAAEEVAQWDQEERNDTLLTKFALAAMQRGEDQKGWAFLNLRGNVEWGARAVANDLYLTHPEKAIALAQSIKTPIMQFELFASMLKKKHHPRVVRQFVELSQEHPHLQESVAWYALPKKDLTLFDFACREVSSYMLEWAAAVAAEKRQLERAMGYLERAGDEDFSKVINRYGEEDGE